VKPSRHTSRSYSQWPSPGRVFRVDRLSRLCPTGAYLPGTTFKQVLRETISTDDGMYRLAPKHLKRLHPNYHATSAAPTHTENLESTETA